MSIYLPNLKPGANRQTVIAAAAARWEIDRPGKPLPDHFVLAVRGYYSESLPPSGNAICAYDDAFFIVTPEGITSWNGNTDPTRFGWNKSASKYMARLCVGSWWFRSLIHRGSYQAFGQSADVVTVDRVREDGTVAKQETGEFGINLHLGGYNTPSSAGCQTLPPTQWTEFRNALNAVLKRFGNRFAFILVQGPIN